MNAETLRLLLAVTLIAMYIGFGIYAITVFSL